MKRSAILNLQREEAIATILALAEKAEKYDRLLGQVSPTTPSGMTPVYLKPSHKKRKKPPGRGKGHPGAARQRPSRSTSITNIPWIIARIVKPLWESL